MIEIRTGDIFSADVDALVNAVNCVGVMGRGIARKFKDAYPINFKEYAKACERNEVQPGKMFVHERDSSAKPRYIINFPTKRHWRVKSRLEDVKSGLEDLRQVIQHQQIRSIAIPALACGLGGLDWDEVRPLIEKSLEDFIDLHAEIYGPIESSQQ